MEADNAIQGRRLYYHAMRAADRAEQMLSFHVCALHQENIEVWHRSELIMTCFICVLIEIDVGYVIFCRLVRNRLMS